MSSGRTRTTRRDLMLSVYLPSALLAVSEGLLLPTLPLFALQFDVSYGVAAMAIAAAGIGTMIADVPAGMILGKLGLKRTMLLGALLIAISLYGLGFAGTFAFVVLYRLIDGVGRAMWALSRVSFITEAIDPSERGRAISIFGGLNRIGMFVGPAAGGFIGTQFGLVTTFYVAGAFATVAMLISFVTVPDFEVEIGGSHKVRWGIVWDLFKANTADLSAAGIAQIAGQMIRQGRQVLIPFFGREVLGLDAAAIGLVQSASSMIDMTLFFPAGYIMDRFGRKFTSVPSFGLMALGLGLLPFTTGFYSLLVVTMIIGFGNGLGSGAMMTLGTDLAPRGAVGEFMGVWRLVGDTGRAGGPIIVGSLADLAGFTVTSLVLAGVGFASSATLGLLVRETRHVPVVIESNADD